MKSKKNQNQKPENQPNNSVDREQELAKREEELAKREQAMRLYEIEKELYQQDPPLYQTTKHEKGESLLRRWSKKIALIGKFLIIVVAVVAAVKVGTWLATAAIVGATAWIGYQIFFESPKKS